MPKRDKVIETLYSQHYAATNEKTIYFIYSELEDYTVTCPFHNLPMAEPFAKSSASIPCR